MSDEKISALLSDDRYDSKDWRHADLAGRIEWLIFMLKAKGEEVENMVRLAEPMLSDALAAAEKHIEELEAKLAREKLTIEALQGLRPVWAQGWTDDSMAAQASGNALTQLWEMLGVKDQTQAVAILAELKGKSHE